MFRLTRWLAFIFLLPLMGCANPNAAPSGKDVFTWANQTLEAALSQTNGVKPEFFELARIPDDFVFPKVPADFGEATITRVISDDYSNFLRDMGIVSSLADHCGLPWQKQNFIPMREWYKSRLPGDERNGYLLYRIGVVHGYAMGKTDTLLKHWKIDCERFKVDIDGKLFADAFPARGEVFP